MNEGVDLTPRCCQKIDNDELRLVRVCEGRHFNKCETIHCR
ncbi:unnamed protein product, partial [Rotaria sp. Silwood1]